MNREVINLTAASIVMLINALVSICFIVKASKMPKNEYGSCHSDAFGIYMSTGISLCINLVWLIVAFSDWLCTQPSGVIK
jgi:hypothetical protein